MTILVPPHAGGMEPSFPPMLGRGLRNREKMQWKMEKRKPVVSIITVVYNAALLLEKTMESVRVQRETYPYIEYIIVDGASKDGTLALIEANRDIVDRFVSEPDKGIYDAMNKGLAMAAGSFVWFLNAGDYIYSDAFLLEVFHEGLDWEREEADAGSGTFLHDNLTEDDGWADIYYGQTQLVDENWQPAGMRRLRAPEVLTPKSFRWGMLVCHQSILVRRSLARPYDMRYHCSADFNWVLYALEKAQRIENVHQTVACYLKGGKSRKMLVRSWFERFAIMRIHFGLLSTLWFHFLILLRAFRPADRNY